MKLEKVDSVRVVLSFTPPSSPESSSHVEKRIRKEFEEDAEIR